MNNEKPAKEKKSVAREVIQWVVIIAAALLLGFLIRTFVFRTATVSGNSMETTLQNNDLLIIAPSAYWFEKPKIGDVIVFPYAGDTSKHYIKRVMGLPGDVIDFRDGYFYRNNQQIQDAFVKGPVDGGSEKYPLTVPAKKNGDIEDAYFVMGDNRGVSDDSRYADVGCIPLSKITGKVILRIWPLNKIGTMPGYSGN